LEAFTGDKISVGAPFFNVTAVWLFIPLLLGVPFGIFLAWKRGNLEETVRRLGVPAGIGVAASLIALAVGGATPKIILALGLGAWVISASVWEVLWRAKFASAPLSETWRRIAQMKRSQFGATIGHIGLGVSIVGIAAASAWNVERLVVLKTGQSVELAGYKVTFKDVSPQTGPNYDELAGTFELSSGDRVLTSIVASKRKYDAPPSATTEAGISPRALGDVYVVLGNEVSPGSYSVRAYFHPFVRWIWGGAAIMFLGGLVSLLDRRLRIGMPQRARGPLTVTPAPAE